MRVIAIRCPSCDQPIHGKSGDRAFYCANCNTVHVREPAPQKIDYEIGSFGPGGDGNRVYVPFWRLYGTVTIQHEQVSGGHVFRLQNWLSGGSRSGNLFIYVPAGPLPPDMVRNWGIALTERHPQYDLKMDFGDVPRLPVTLTRQEAGELADFIVLTMEAQQPGTLQQLSYTLEINTSKLVYLPFYERGGQYVLAV